MKENKEVVLLEFRLHENKEALAEKNEYDHYFLKKIIDNSLINTFGILEASKIQYDLITFPATRDFQLRTTKKHKLKILTGVVMINSNTEEILRIESYFKYLKNYFQNEIFIKMGNLCGKTEVSNMYLETQKASMELVKEGDIKKVIYENEGYKNENDSILFENSILETSKHNRGKKKKKFPDLDTNKFSQELLTEINILRKNPKFYIDKIEKHSNYVTFKDGKILYENQDNKFILNRGIPAFKDCIQILKNINGEIPYLELSDTIRIEVPDCPEEQMKYESFINEMRQRHRDKIIEFNFDINHPIAELIIVLQLVDDNKFNGKRRNNLLSEKFSKLGISIKKGKGKHYTIYLTFSN